MNSRCEYQVIVVGAGIAGASLALALGRAGLRVALIEKQVPDEYQKGQNYGLRVSAISLASQYLLHNLGVWAAIAQARLCPYQRMHIWDALGKAVLDFDCVEYQLGYLGHIVENELIQSELLHALTPLDNVDLICPAQVTDLIYAADNIGVKLKGGDCCSAQLVVAADGPDSSIRRLAQIEVDTWSYQQQGVVAVVKPQQSHKATAWQRFLPTGPLAFLPLANDCCSIVWSTSDAEAQRLVALDETTFCSELSSASAGCLGGISSSSQRAAFPLRYQHARTYIKQRVALVGDAAHVVHPLAGQGVNLGLLDVVQLAEQLIDSHECNKDVGSAKLLRRYQRNRYTENQIMALSFDALNRLYVAQRAPLVKLRNTGLAVVNQLTVLKRLFVSQATGLQTAIKKSTPSTHKNSKKSLLRPPDFASLRHK